MADVGQTYNSSLTAQYIQVFDGMTSAAGGIDMILNVADLTYADNYGPTAELPAQLLQHLRCLFGGLGRTNQQRWDCVEHHVAGRAGRRCHRPRRWQPPRLTARLGIVQTYTDNGWHVRHTPSVNAAGQPNIRSRAGRRATRTAPSRRRTVGDIWSSSPGSPRTWAPCTWWC
jgi:hypothetical protein